MNGLYRPVHFFIYVKKINFYKYVKQERNRKTWTIR